MAVASPIRAPRGQRGRTAAQSATTMAASTASTWPNRISSRIGNRYAQAQKIAANATGASGPARRSSGRNA